MRHARPFGVVGLDGKDHDVDKANIHGRFGGPYMAQDDLAERALHPQAVPLHGFKVGTARDEDDVFAGLGEPRAQIATDTA